MLCCSTLVSDHSQLQTQPLKITKTVVMGGTARSVTPATPKCMSNSRSSALNLIVGAKSMVGVAAVGLFPGPGAVIRFDLFCVFPPLSSECQS